MKAVLLCGGKGTRLGKNTSVMPKSLLPVYDRPMVYYPLEIASMLCDEVMIITSVEHHELFKRQLENVDADFVLAKKNVVFAKQENPTGGIGEALKIAENWLGGEDCLLILGDNVFIPSKRLAWDISERKQKSAIIGIEVSNPSEYGVIKFTDDRSDFTIIEKPTTCNWRDPLAVPGIYVFEGSSIQHIHELKPSARGQLEITDFINLARSKGHQYDVIEPADMFWFDAGTPDRLLDASNLVRAYMKR